MKNSIKLVIASMLMGAIGMAAIPADHASAATATGNKTAVEAGQTTLVAQGKKKAPKMKSSKKVRSMKRR